MTIEVLIHTIVHQTMVLIAQLAASRRGRAPLAQVANQVFLDLVRELERQGVSRKVGADMFGLGLRTYQRKIQRLAEGSTERGRSLWGAVLDFVQEQGNVARAEVLGRFSADDELQVRSVLHDLCESGLVVASGAGAQIAYRVTAEEELHALHHGRGLEGLEELLWALIYREGPLSLDELTVRAPMDETELHGSLERLLAEGRVQRSQKGEKAYYQTNELVLPLGSPVGFEAAVFDHFQAMVNTITCRLREDRAVTSRADLNGGSTYTLEVWPGHPLQEEVYASLGRLRAELGELRQRVEQHNAGTGVPEDHTKVTLYAGQCLIAQGNPTVDDVD